MKKFTIILCLCILVSAFAFMFVFSVFLPRTTVSDYSILSEWPEFTLEALFSGEYFSDVMYYFTDTIYARDRFIDIEARIRALYGIEQEQQLIIIDPNEVDPDADKYNSEDESTTSEDDFSAPNTSSDPSTESSVDQPEDSSVVPDDTSNESSEPDNSSTFIPDESQSGIVSDPSSQTPESSDTTEAPPAEMSGSVLIVGTRALEIFYGNEKNAAVFAEVLNNFADSLDPSVNVYSMVIPKASAYYLGQTEKYAHLSPRNKNNIDVITNNLSNRVIDVNIYNILGQHANEEIYLRTDHHWSALGAYYASSIFASKAGVGFDPIDEFTEVRREGYLGTMYKYSNNSSILLNNPEDFVAYYPDADYEVTYYSASDLTSSAREHEGGFFWEISDSRKSDWYSTFLRGDTYSVKAVSNDCKNGRKLLIVKDSYGNALAPFMLEGFEEIYIVDARQYEISLKETIDKFGITDVLFAECTFSAVGSSYINQLKEICK